jgi:hypothetical protein
MKLWQPEETIGTIWHRFITGVDVRTSFLEAAVRCSAFALPATRQLTS